MYSRLWTALLLFPLCLAAAGCQGGGGASAGQAEDGSDQFFKPDSNADFAGSHILVAYQGAERANPQITRSKEEAKAKAQELIDQIKADPSKFEELARQESDGPSAARDGSLGSWQEGRMVPEFDAAVKLLEVGQITSEPVETAFGFHVIRRDSLEVEHFGVEALVIGYKGAPRAPQSATRSQEEAQALIEEISAKINGGNFDEMVVQYTDSENKEPVYMGALKKGDQAPQEVMDAVTQLKVGEVSGALEMPYGYAFLRRIHLEQRAGAHILVAYQGALRAAPEVTRSKEEALERAKEVLAQVQQDVSQFAELAKEHSDGPSAPQGGDLGVWFKGRMVAVFDESMGEIEPGQVYPEPVESEFGYHILLRKALP